MADSIWGYSPRPEPSWPPPISSGFGAALDCAADARYAELLARLQHFLPALRAAASTGIDFESTWTVVKVCVFVRVFGGVCVCVFEGCVLLGIRVAEGGGGEEKQTESFFATVHLNKAKPLLTPATLLSVVDACAAPQPLLNSCPLFRRCCSSHVLQAELSALVSAARLSSLQAGRLEMLDSEVVKLQRLLALVGKHIKAGAQQHQVGVCFVRDRCRGVFAC